MAENLYIALKKEPGKNPEYRFQRGERYDENRQGYLVHGCERGVYNLMINFITENEGADKKYKPHIKLKELDEKNLDEKISRIFFEGVGKEEISKILSNPQLYGNDKLKKKFEDAFSKHTLV